MHKEERYSYTHPEPTPGLDGGNWSTANISCFIPCYINPYPLNRRLDRPINYMMVIQ
jgi:hypothetical protein